MPIISVRDNENNVWKRKNRKTKNKNKDIKEQVGTDARVML